MCYMLRYLKLKNKYAILKVKYEKLLKEIDLDIWGDIL